MGNSSSPLTDYQLVRAFRQDEWIKQNYDHHGELWRSKFTHEMVRVHPLRQIPSIQDMHRYQLRSTNQYVVKIYNIAIDHYSSVCTSNQNALLLVEHIPLRLIDLRTLDLEESLTVLHSAFRGFHTIQAFFECVEPSEQLIGFNEQGKTKVWLNRQFNLNNVAQESKSTDPNQFNRVKKIVKMIERKIGESQPFEWLKHQILQNSVNYFEASIIIEEFAFKEQLSLKRYVRTDLLTRPGKPETHRRNLTTSSFFPTERSHIDTSRKSDVFIPAHPLQKIKSWDRFPTGQSNLGSRAGSPHISASKSIPKITFNLKNVNEKGFMLQKGQPKVTFSSPKAQQRISFLSTTSSMWSSPVKIHQPEAAQQTTNKKKQQLNLKTQQSILKEQQPTQSKEEIISKQSQYKKQNLQNILNQQKQKLENQTKSQKHQKQLQQQKQQKQQQQERHQQQQTDQKQERHQKQQKRPGDLIKKIVSQEQQEPKTIQKYQPIVNENEEFFVIDSPIMDQQIFQVPSKKHSMIDECEKYLQQPKISQQQKQQPVYQQIWPIQDPQEIKVSGLFQQVAEQQNLQMSPQFAKDAQQSYQKPTVYVQEGITLQLQSQNKQIPINFESFAPFKDNFNQNVSFAPKLTQQNNEEKGIVVTSKSLDLRQREQQQRQLQEQSQICSSNEYEQQVPKKSFRLVESQQRVENKPIQAANEQRNYTSNGQPQLIAKNRISPEIQQQFSAIGRQEKPFYEEYTPVESKFDILIKRDSNADHDKQMSEHSHRLSAFGNVQDEECYERNMKNKLKEMFPSDELRINRISSEYQTNTKRITHDSPRQPKPLIKANKISNINERVQQDFLDINHLQRTLEMRCSKKEKVHKKSDEFDVDKLQEKLMKFSSSKGQVSEQQNTYRQSKETYTKPKVSTKVSQFVAQQNETYRQNLERQVESPKNTSKIQQYSSNFRVKDDNKGNDIRPKYQSKQSYNYYKTYNLQKDIVDRTTNKFNSYAYNQYSNLSSFKTQPYNSVGYSYFNQKPNDFIDKYAVSSYTDRFTDILPPFSKIKKQPDALLEERYQKYVKQGKQKHTLNKQKSADSFAKVYQDSKQPIASQSKRISYENLRQYLKS